MNLYHEKKKNKLTSSIKAITLFTDINLMLKISSKNKINSYFEPISDHNRSISSISSLKGSFSNKFEIRSLLLDISFSFVFFLGL